MAGNIASAEPAPAEEVKSPGSRHSSSSGHGVEIDAASEKRLVRKLDRRLVVLAFLCYMAAFLDRSNIGNAETAGMSEDIGFDNDQYQVRTSHRSEPRYPALTPADTSHSGCSPYSTSRTSSSSGSRSCGRSSRRTSGPLRPSSPGA